MPIYISILRGINVSGQRMIKMNALKELCSNLGFLNVQTYIQSGNIVFQYKKEDTSEISSTLKTAIEKAFGFDVPVITLTLDELKNVVEVNPFMNDASMQGEHFHVTFFADKPEAANYELIKVGDYKNDKFKLIGRLCICIAPIAIVIQNCQTAF